MSAQPLKPGVDLRDEASRYRILLEINNASITSPNKKQLLQAVTRALRQVIRLDGAVFVIFQPGTDYSLINAFEGDNSSVITTGQKLSLRHKKTGQLYDFKPLLRHDLTREEEREYEGECLAYADGLLSICVVPLKVKARPIGVMAIGSKIRNQYTEADLEFVQEVANQVAPAISNMMAFEESQKLNAKLAAMAEKRRTLLEINNAIITSLSESELLNAVTESLKRMVSFDHVAFALYEPSVDEESLLVLDGRYTLSVRAGQRFSIRKLKTGELYDFRPLLRRDFGRPEELEFEGDVLCYASGLLSMCIVPLTIKGEPLGIMSVGSRQKNQYHEGDLEFLQEVGNQIALALANVKSYEEIAALKRQLQAENIYLQEEILLEHNFEEIIGNSPALLEVLQQVERVAPTDATVLITGETGTGKELIARAIHNFSGRKNRPLVKINCGAISAGLVESELFGHKKGAFTGAVDNRIGRFELANGGTVFLDEVGELPLETQVKLLRVLQEGEFEPVGSSRTIKTDVRVIAATNRDPEAEISAGTFRADLFYRLNVFPVRVPPLRQRREDIPALVMFFLERFSKKFGKRVRNVPLEVMNQLLSYDWMGNIRELQNVIERAVVLAHPAAVALSADLLPVLSGAAPSPASLSRPAPPVTANGADAFSPAALRDIERRHILSVLEQSSWKIEGRGGAAQILQLHPNTLRSRMKKLGLQRPDRTCS